jgi:hypothetical protein
MLYNFGLPRNIIYMKNIFTIIILVIIAGFIYVFAMDKGMVADQPNNQATTTATSTMTGGVTGTTNAGSDTNGAPAQGGVVELNVSGTIAKVDSSQTLADGPYVITVNIEGGKQVYINVPSMGINLCAAKASMADVSTLKAGDKIEARGQIAADGSIVPCEYSSHYLRVVAR